MSQPVRVKTPLGGDLLFKSMTLVEELGRPFECELELLSPKEDIELDNVLGRDMTVEIDLENGKQRYVHGFVSEMAQTGRSGKYAVYTASVRPWLWFLTRSADCRIFQNLKAPEIIKKVFRDHGFSDFKESLTESYRKWEYCVQYRETDFNFVSRLMEQEGIYYFVEHESGKDVLVLADSSGAHNPLPGYAKVPYYPPSSNVVREEHVFDWRLTKSVRTGSYRLNAFHFKKPRTKLEVYAPKEFGHPHGDHEYFDYPGEHYEKDEGDRYVAVRIEEIAAQHERVVGQSDAKGLFPGGLFKLTDHPRGDQNREYLITSVKHYLSLGDYESKDQDELEYTNSFQAIPSSVPFRPERVTPKPVMQGPQTAIVVGKNGEEIDTDEFGRVKVQFHWDRQGKSDENSSCWVRVAQVWAGGQWGGMTIPRIGQEVIVDFIEGDPDRPIVTGRVYNADNMPPYTLPDKKTQSGIKSRSTKGGGADNFNEIRFEDKKGEEEMYIHAEKDQNVVVENNQTIKVGFEKKDKGDRMEAVYHDRVLEVGNDKSEKVGRNKRIEVTAQHQEKIGGSMNVNVAKNLTETVGINYAETVGAAMELTVGAALAMSVGAAKTETVGASSSETVGGNKSTTVNGGYSLEVGKDFAQEIQGVAKVVIAKDSEEKVDGKARVEIAKEFSLNAKKIQIVGEDEISLTAGSAKIVLKKNGDITVSGNKISIKGSGDVIVKGSNIKGN